MTNHVDMPGVQRDIHPSGAELDENKRLSSNTERLSAGGSHKGHRMLMLLCCIPMLVLAVVLVVSGVINPGFLISAVACTAMMFAMMRMMPGH
jgi:Flp pilus assembly protein TadB